jgi:hypothetical protein
LLKLCPDTSPRQADGFDFGFGIWDFEKPNQPIQLNKLNQLNQPLLKSRRRPPFAEDCFAGGIFSDVLFQLFAPQGLKCPAAAVQRVDFGEIAMFT